MLSSELQAFDKLFASLNAPDFIERLQTHADTWLNNSTSRIKGFIEDKKKSAAGNLLYKGITGVLAITTSVVAPVVELIIIALPEIISLITDFIKKKKAKEEIRNQIIGQIPAIKRDIRTKVITSLTEQTQAMVQSISSNFEEMLKVKAAEIEKAQADLAKTQDVSTEIKKLTHNLTRLEAIEKQL